MSKERIDYLLESFFAGTCKVEEQEELAYWIRQIGDEELEWQLEHQWNQFRHEKQMDEKKANLMLSSILKHKTQKLPEASVHSLAGNVWRFVAAAVLIFIVGVSGYFYWIGADRAKSAPVSAGVSQPVPDIAPGRDNAVLTLADGRQVILDTSNRKVTQENGVTVINLQGQLNYTSGTEVESDAVYYHTLSTPNGGQYQLVLADGSKVWLNAVSSLRFPTAFVANSRTVELTGEGYFEVKTDPAKPFHVVVGSMDVQVLGTHFNVNAYHDEKSINTTLVEGSVKVSSRDAKVLLKPGQQARLYDHSSSNKNDGLQVVSNIDLNGVTAWKNGYFYFNSADITTIMRQLSRWYDIEIVYDGDVMGQNETFSGKVHRNMSLRNILEVLSFSHLDVKLNGKKLTVSANKGVLKK